MKETNKIGLVVDDMFFAAKILGAAETVGREVERIKSREQLENEMVFNPPALLIVDLNASALDAIETIEFCRSRPELNKTPILGFFSHVQAALKHSAEEAGCDLVMPRSQFTQKLNEIVSGDFEIKLRR